MDLEHYLSIKWSFMTLVQGPSLKHVSTYSQEFRPNHTHYSFISVAMILVSF
jgi:hypothetical protein